jgi:hypothetical protein
MEIVRETIIKKLAERFATLSNVVSIQNKSGLNDINKSAERLFIDVLNLIYHLNLRDMNEIQANYPAIDLGDYNSRICFQVTSESSNSKFKKTVDKYKNKGLDKHFDKLCFLIISNTDKCSLTDKEVETSVININDLAIQAFSLNDQDLQYLDSYLDTNLVSRIETRSSILPPQIISSFNTPEPTAFIKHLCIENEDVYINELKADLKSFTQKLLSLTEHQKEFLYYIVSQGQYPLNSIGRGYSEHTVCIPTTQIEQTFGDYGKQLFDSLKAMDLVYLNDEYDPQNDDRFITALEVYYNGISEDLNLFSSFKSFCNGNNLLLHKIIVGCDLSCLS